MISSIFLNLIEKLRQDVNDLFLCVNEQSIQ